MRALVQRAAAGSLWLSVVAFPASAQVDRIGGPVEFRSADRPIGAPTLRFAESGSPDTGISLPASPPAPDDVLKQIDKELGQTGTKSTTGADRGTLGSPETADERSGLGRIGVDRTTFK
jgi:hypothetical protein